MLSDLFIGLEQYFILFKLSFKNTIKRLHNKKEIIIIIAYLRIFSDFSKLLFKIIKNNCRFKL